jgi:predicted outer membrane protein
MKMSYLKMGIALMALCGLGMTTFLSAEQPAAQAQKGRAVAGQAETLDHQFAACVTLANQNEVAAAKIAQQRSKSPEVKSFAQALEKDHQQFITNLERFGGNQFQNRKTWTTGQAAAGERRAEPNSRLAGSQPATVEALNQLRLEMADECLASMQRELSSKEGREFDKCFIGSQIGGHMYLIDELKVLERHASSDLQGTLRTGRETAQKHLDRAKEIMKDIEKNETKTAAK